PLPPILDSIETGEHDATVSYFPPKEANITFHIEYYPEDNREYANVIETKATLVRLRGLDSGTAFRIKIRSVYNGVLSPDMIESVFRTSGAEDSLANSQLLLVLAEYDYENSAETFSIRTLPPGFDLATTTAANAIGKSDDYLYSAEDLDDEDSLTSTIYFRANNCYISSIIVRSSYVYYNYRHIYHKYTAAVHFFIGFVYQFYGEVEQALQLLSAKQMAAEFGEPSWISMSDEANMIRLNWTIPDGSLCDAFLVNYTVVTLTRPKSYSVATMDDFLLIKFFANHTLDLRVFCMLAGSVSKTWWAHRIVQLTNPQPVQDVRIISSETDEFYVSRISIDWDWPAFHNPDLYHIIISYSINGGTETEFEITESEQKPFVLNNLEPTQLYRISVRNESLELGLSSKVVQLERITPPIISSMISPGKISSTSININFGDSDIEQGRFDYYELIFTGNNKNITQKIQVNEE
ncbi:unnamed protein product, partial [Haemonchus placei]|uniref:Fibronectin type-III domain-containing protein n=1 Tax=Haemonchus placei TaxID=6290 RepID=A0A0N4VSX0_HAEPC